jgi:hypothetical protein
MDPILKQFLQALATEIGGTMQEAALEAVRIAACIPNLSRLLPAGYEAKCAVDLGDLRPAVADTSALDAEIADAKSKIASLEAAIKGRDEHISNLIAAAAVLVETVPEPKAPKAPKAEKPPKAPKAEKAPKAPKAEKAPKAAKEPGAGVTALVIDGAEVAIRSFRAGLIYMMRTAVDAGHKAALPAVWFRDTPDFRTVTLPSGEHAVVHMDATQAELRIRKIAKVIGVTLTVKSTNADGSTTEA